MTITTFRQFDQAMKKWRVNYWLMYGTLLDAVRGNANDEDIDIGIYEEDMVRIMDFGNGFAYKYYWNYGSNPIINVQAWKVIGDSRYYQQGDWFQQKLPVNMLMSCVKYKGVECKIPFSYERLLNNWFSDWKVPMDEKARTKIYKIKLDHHENDFRSPNGSKK